MTQLSNSNSAIKNVSKLARRAKLLALIGVVSLLSTSAQAATVTKLDNVTLLNAVGSWSNAAVPTVGNLYSWTNAVTAPNVTVGIGGNITMGGIRITNPAQSTHPAVLSTPQPRSLPTSASSLPPT